MIKNNILRKVNSDKNSNSNSIVESTDLRFKHKSNHLRLPFNQRFRFKQVEIPDPLIKFDYNNEEVHSSDEEIIFGASFDKIKRIHKLFIEWEYAPRSFIIQISDSKTLIRSLRLEKYYRLEIKSTIKLF